MLLDGNDGDYRLGRNDHAIRETLQDRVVLALMVQNIKLRGVLICRTFALVTVGTCLDPPAGG